MSAAPRLFTIPPGAPFLPTLAEALLSGRLVPGFRGNDPLELAKATIYLPTRRAARELRNVFVGLANGTSAILPTIRALGEFDEDGALFDADFFGSLDLEPPIAPIDRLLLLADLVRAWKRRLPAHVAQLYQEEVIVPASASDAIWHARDLAGLMDEIETEGSDWTRLADLVTGELAGWWQVTLDFLTIVTEQWPAILHARRQSNPAAHRSRLIRLEAERLKRNPPAGPVIAAGSTGSIPATCELLSVIARLDRGAVVLPGLDLTMDAESGSVIDTPDPEPTLLGHPQYGLAKLLRALKATRAEVEEIGRLAQEMQARRVCVSEALRPAATTDAWAVGRNERAESVAAALADVTLIEAANERDEAAAIAIALKQGAAHPDSKVALVTPDRNLARRVSTELLRLNVVADDSGGTPLNRTPPAELLTLMLEAVFRPGDPVSIVALLKHPLLTLGLERPAVRAAAETIELIALRGGAGRPDIAGLGDLFERRLTEARGGRPPFWLSHMSAGRIEAAQAVAARLHEALAPLAALREQPALGVAELARATILAFEALGRSADGGLAELYRGEAGERLADVLRALVGSDAPFNLAAQEWPDVLQALIAPEVVKPRPGAESRIAIWGALEARLQTVDLLVIGGLNEGSWPRKAEADRFMSRMMKTGLALEPPERRIGLAAHDFAMAMGARQVVLSRSARSGDSPAVASRWLQRLLTYAGEDEAKRLKERGDLLLGWARQLDGGGKEPFAARPNPAPPLEARPTRFSITEIETLRRDPYAVYAKRILDLQPLDPMIADPGVADRGILFHDILHRFTETVGDPRREGALETLIEAGRAAFAELDLPPDIRAIWWPRFERMAPEILDWEIGRAPNVTSRHAEANADEMPVGASGATLRGRADRIDLLPAGMADILDYKTGSSPSKAQAHTLLSPQLALEGALLRRGAFKELGKPGLADLAYVRLRGNGEVVHESILEYKRQIKPAGELADEAWKRLEQLLLHYRKPDTGYLSRALPFREGETDGDYDHLARVLEWSAGGDEAEGGDT
jgi:ATP-dependent helicase/nuclease subunit B